MRSALLASTAFLQAMFSCARYVRRVTLTVVVFTAVFCISTYEVRPEPVRNQTINATVYGTATYANNAPVKHGTLYVNIGDAVANTTRQATLVTNEAGQYTITASFTCNSSTNSISFGFGFRGLLDDGRLQPLGDYGGGAFCPNGDHPPQELPLLFSRPAGNYAGPMCPAPGKPVNPTNGNMWVQQTDYTLPGGATNGINLTRTYNSMTPNHGYFGFGWKSDFDERVYFHPNSSGFLADHLGSTNGLTNSSGGLTASNSYDSFGNPTNTSFSTRYQFTGREFDSFAGLQYSRARFYDPNLGRFISEDPIGFKGGDVNLYGYVLNRPLMHRDPSGKIIPLVAGGIAVAALILASPSYLNAPGQGDPVYREENPIILNAALGAVCGLAYETIVGPALGRIVSSAFPKRFPVKIENPVLNSPRSGSGLKFDYEYPRFDSAGKMTQEFPPRPKAHGFPDMVDNYAGSAQKFSLGDADLYQLSGANNGVSGRFEWIIQDGLVVHRMFVSNGTINGVPIRP